jgi:hypothetical protein
MKKKLTVSFLSFIFISTLNTTHSMDMFESRFESSTTQEETKSRRTTFTEKENTGIFNNFHKSSTTQEKKLKECSGGQKNAYLTNSTKQNNVSVNNSNSVNQSASLQTTHDGWTAAMSNISRQTYPTGTSRAIIGSAITPKKSVAQHKSLQTTEKTNEELANKVGDLIESSLINSTYSNNVTNAVKEILNKGFQVNMGGNKGGFPNIHEHQDKTPAVLHATVCNECCIAEKIKCSSCNKKESYTGLTLQGKIDMRNECFYNSRFINRIMTVNITDPNKQLNGKGADFHIKLLQWIPEDLAFTLHKTLRKGNDLIDIKFKEKPVYRENFQQISNQNCGHNKIKKTNRCHYNNSKYKY